jgi:hypothetical protein
MSHPLGGSKKITLRMKHNSQKPKVTVYYHAMGHMYSRTGHIILEPSANGRRETEYLVCRIDVSSSAKSVTDQVSGSIRVFVNPIAVALLPFGLGSGTLFTRSASLLEEFRLHSPSRNRNVVRMSQVRSD